jgi:hypothetical protein
MNVSFPLKARPAIPDNPNSVRIAHSFRNRGYS